MVKRKRKRIIALSLSALLVVTCVWLYRFLAGVDNNYRSAIAQIQAGQVPPQPLTVLKKDQSTSGTGSKRSTSFYITYQTKTFMEVRIAVDGSIYRQAKVGAPAIGYYLAEQDEWFVRPTPTSRNLQANYYIHPKAKWLLTGIVLLFGAIAVSLYVVVA